jgi:hypothetical protein
MSALCSDNHEISQCGKAVNRRYRATRRNATFHGQPGALAHVIDDPGKTPPDKNQVVLTPHSMRHEASA